VKARRVKQTWSAAVLATAVAFGTAGGGCARHHADSGPHRQVIVLGFDGMDYTLTRQMMEGGRLPNFQHLAAKGGFGPLETSIPPQSPVAWSDFITGTDAGGHGIFDFVHRDPKTMQPYLSTSRTEPGRTLRLGSWRIPLTGGKVELLRHGAAFWEQLEARGIPATIVRIPANFPPAGTATRELSGMGTPDLLGGYGTFTYYTSDARAAADTKVGGGRIVAVRPLDGGFHEVLHGPSNPLREAAEELTAEFDLAADPERPLARLRVGSEERLLQAGEWSDWVPVHFRLAPGRSLRGMCRFYLRQVRPLVELYVTPINIDPLQPALPISNPPDWAADLARRTGRYYTQGMPEDTKAYADSVFNTREFLAQAQLPADEVRRQYEDLLPRFTGGLLFYYFSTTDQVSHMMWRPMDPQHPAYQEATDAPFADVVPRVYEAMDSIVGWTLAHMDTAATLIVMSDHGFTSWRRSFNLNGWLRDNGYLAVKNPNATEDAGMLSNIDWEHTRAYGLGLNGLYVNQRGRECWGIVPPDSRDALLDEIAAKLLATLDPATGAPAVTHADRTDRVFKGREFLALGPDIIVGYARGTRCSDSSGLGEVPAEVFTDNRAAWSGDHCMDHVAVPGILLSNRPLAKPAHRLQDLGAAIVAEFGSGAAAKQDGGR
jgi:predicted AlkP superfamily phosphohydrolase/phosphomutase